MKFDMKKFMAVLAAMMMVFALAACGDDKEPAKQGGDTNDGPSAFELYNQAEEKMAALTDVEYKMDVAMKMAAEGQNMDMTMGGTMKQVKVDENNFNLQFNMNMDMSAMGAGTMDMNMYYTNGYLYYDMGQMGQMKVAMDMAAAEEQMNANGMAELDESWVKESSVDGQNVHMVLDGTKMTGMVDEYAGSMAATLQGGEITMGDVTVDLVLDAEGLPTTYKMVMPMTVNTQGIEMTMDMDMTMDVIATEGVTIEFPEGMDSWMEVDASALQ